MKRETKKGSADCVSSQSVQLRRRSPHRDRFWNGWIGLLVLHRTSTRVPAERDAVQASQRQSFRRFRPFDVRRVAIRSTSLALSLIPSYAGFASGVSRSPTSCSVPCSSGSDGLVRSPALPSSLPVLLSLSLYRFQAHLHPSFSYLSSLRFPPNSRPPFTLLLTLSPRTFASNPGFNGGSTFAANLRAAMAIFTTNLAGAAGGITWMLLDFRVRSRKEEGYG